MRAYSQAAQAGLAESQVVTKQVGRKLTIDTDYNGIGKLQYIAAQLELAVLDTVYSDKVQMVVLAPEDKVHALEKKVTEASSGQASIDISDELYFADIDAEAVVFED